MGSTVFVHCLSLHRHVKQRHTKMNTTELFVVYAVDYATTSIQRSDLRQSINAKVQCIKYNPSLKTAVL